MTTPPSVDVDTSRDAAESMKPHAGRVREAVLAIIRHSWPIGVTCDEIEVTLKLAHQTASARVRELVLAKEVVDSGQRRPTRTGRKAAVYVVMSSTPDAQHQSLR